MFSAGALMVPASLAEWGRIAAVALVVGGLSFTLGRCDGVGDERARQAAARAEANVEALQRDRGARDAAADQRVADATDVAAHEKGLIDAIADTPDEAPDAVRVRLGCERLRAAGADPASLPAVCRPGR